VTLEDEMKIMDKLSNLITERF